VGKQSYLHIELKNTATLLDALVPKVAEWVRRHALPERVLFHPFVRGEASAGCKNFSRAFRAASRPIQAGWVSGAGRSAGGVVELHCLPT